MQLFPGSHPKIQYEACTQERQFNQENERLNIFTSTIEVKKGNQKSSDASDAPDECEHAFGSPRLMSRELIFKPLLVSH